MKNGILKRWEEIVSVLRKWQELVEKLNGYTLVKNNNDCSVLADNYGNVYALENNCIKQYKMKLPSELTYKDFECIFKAHLGNEKICADVLDFLYMKSTYTITTEGLDARIYYELWQDGSIIKNVQQIVVPINKTEEDIFDDIKRVSSKVEHFDINNVSEDIYSNLFINKFNIDKYITGQTLYDTIYNFIKWLIDTYNYDTLDPINIDKLVSAVYNQCIKHNIKPLYNKIRDSNLCLSLKANTYNYK